MARIGETGRTYFSDRYGAPKTLLLVVSQMPYEALRELTDDELLKLRLSSITMMSDTVENAIDGRPEMFVVHKIINSMLRWGVSRGSRNDIVYAYDGLKSFDLGVEGFTVTLDHTTYHNERGWSEYRRTFLDGVFGLMVHHRGQHVMTIGFSFARGRRLLLQQVQLVNRRGNRWLFRLPSNRMEYVIDRLATAFPQFIILIADGASITRINLESYRRGIADVARRIERELASTQDEGSPAYLSRLRTNHSYLVARHAHLRQDSARLAAFYRDTGRFTLGAPLTMNGVKHYAIAA